MRKLKSIYVTSFSDQVTNTRSRLFSVIFSTFKQQTDIDAPNLLNLYDGTSNTDPKILTVNLCPNSTDQYRIQGPTALNVPPGGILFSSGIYAEVTCDPADVLGVCFFLEGN
jgi:hypothetical protein